MNSFDFAFVTWWPLIFYPATDAPNFRKGYISSLVVGTLTIPLILLIAWLEHKDTVKGKIGRVYDEGRDEETKSVRSEEDEDLAAINIERDNGSEK